MQKCYYRFNHTFNGDQPSQSSFGSPNSQRGGMYQPMTVNHHMFAKQPSPPSFFPTFNMGYGSQQQYSSPGPQTSPAFVVNHSHTPPYIPGLQPYSQAMPAHPNPFSSMPPMSAMATTPGSVPEDKGWYPDSEATNHVTNDLTSLNTCATYSGVAKLFIGNGTGVSVQHIGYVFFPSY